MRVTLVVLLITMSMLPLGFLLYPQAAAENITVTSTTFGSGQSDITVDFPSANINTDNTISVQSGLNINEAKLKVSSVAQSPGSKNYPSNVTIDFGGDNLNEWQWKGPGLGQLGRQTIFTNGKNLVNMTVNAGVSDNSLAIRLPKNANIRSANLNMSVGSRIGTPGKILVIYATGYSSCTNDVQSHLEAFSDDFSTVDMWDAGASTPNWDDISSYSSILLWNHGYDGYRFSDKDTLGDLMADYVDAGGGVVLCQYLFAGGWNGNLGGRFNNDGYYVIPSNNNGMSGYSSMTIGKVDQPNHPVMQNVSSININNIMWTVSASVGPGQELFSWSSGAVGAATKNINGVDRVDLQIMPYSDQASFPYYSQGYNGDGNDLLKNSLLFAGRKPLTASVDILNDSVPEFNETGFAGNFTFPGLDQLLRDYLATANVTFTDGYGNEFVDVPINVTARSPGLVQFNNLEVLYDYSTDIDKNPATGDLTSSLADLQSAVQSKDNYDIPIYISSTTAGEIKLSGLFLNMSPPNHAPHIDSFFPPVNTVVKEDTTVDLGINATDIYGNPMSYSWTVDGAAVDGAITDRLSHYFDLESSGTHFVRANVSNPISARTFTTMSWNITVLNVNRPPAITDSSPVSSPSINENSTQLFTVTASDPDKEDANGLSYTWFLDGRIVQGVNGNNYTYVTNFKSGGQHVVKVVVTDASNATDSKSWAVTVIDVDVAPAIAGFSPRDDPTISETDSRTFSVTPFDPDENQTLLVNWYVDDVAVFIGNPYTFTTDYRSAGVHTIKATISDGQLSAARSWTVTVLNLNRVPLAVIDSPSDQSEYMQGDAIHFSGRSSSDPDNDALSFTWKEGGANVSDQMEFDRAFSPGIHTLVLEVRDGQGGMTSTSVRFRVKYIELAVEIGLDRLEIQAGNKVDVILTMTNIGDADAGNMTLAVSVDGTGIGSSTLAAMKAGGAQRQIFNWKAVKGDHTITAKIGDQTWTKQVTVGAAPAPPPAAGIGDYIWMIVLVVLVVGLVGFGAAVLGKR